MIPKELAIRINCAHSMEEVLTLIDRFIEEYDPKKVIRFANREKIIDIFGNYNFKDPYENELLNCQDFQDLVDRAVGD